MSRWHRIPITALIILMGVCCALEAALAGSATDATVIVKFVPQMPPAGRESQRHGEDSTTAGHEIVDSALQRPDAWRYFGKSIWDPAFSFDGGKYLLCGANPAVGQPGFVVRVASPLPKRSPADGKGPWPWVMVLEDGTVWVIRLGGAESPIRGENENISYYQWKNGTTASHEYILGEPKRGAVWTCHYVKVRYDESKSEYVPLASRRMKIRKLWL